jgi:hypothetical protein
MIVSYLLHYRLDKRGYSKFRSSEHTRRTWTAWIDKQCPELGLLCGFVPGNSEGSLSSGVIGPIERNFELGAFARTGTIAIAFSPVEPLGARRESMVTLGKRPGAGSDG